MPLLAALAFPRASCQELRGILDYMTVSFMLEELTYALFIISSANVLSYFVQ